MPRYYYPQTSVANPSLSAGMFTDPSQLRVSAANLSSPGYDLAQTQPSTGGGYGPGWSRNGQTWSNDYQFDPSASGALQRVGAPSDLADQFQTEQTIRQLAASAVQRAAMQGNPAQDRTSTQPLALTDKISENRILGGIQNPQALALQLRQQTDSQMNPQPGFGIAGSNLLIGGHTLPIPAGADPDQFAADQQKAMAAQQAASVAGRTKYDVFSSQPQLQNMLEPARQALFQATYGQQPDPIKQVENVNRSIDAYTKQFGVNPVAAINEMEARGAKEGSVIAMPGKFDKGVDSQNPTYVSGPNVHLSPGLVRIGKGLRKQLSDAQGTSGDLTASPYPAGYDPTVPAISSASDVPQQPGFFRRLFGGSATPAPAATPAPLLQSSATPAPATAASNREVKIYNGKRYLVDHVTHAVTPM